MSNFIPYGVGLGIGEVFEKVRAWAYRAFSLKTIRTAGLLSNMASFRFCQREGGEDCLDVWYYHQLNYNDETCEIGLILNNKKVAQSYRWSQFDPSCADGEVQSAIDEFIGLLRDYFFKVCRIDYSPQFWQTQPKYFAVRKMRKFSIDHVGLCILNVELENGAQLCAVRPDGEADWMDSSFAREHLVSVADNGQWVFLSKRAVN